MIFLSKNGKSRKSHSCGLQHEGQLIQDNLARAGGNGNSFNNTGRNQMLAHGITPPA